MTLSPRRVLELHESGDWYGGTLLASVGVMILVGAVWLAFANIFAGAFADFDPRVMSLW